MTAKDLRNKLKRFENEKNLPFITDELMARLAERRIVVVGQNIKCTICGQESWHVLKSLAEKLECPKCLEVFPFPTGNPIGEAHWAYKLGGAFSLPACGYGSLSSLLTILFFQRLIYNGVTFAFSMNVERHTVPLEIDLVLFCASSRVRDTIEPGRTAFVECKSWNHFTSRDISRMVDLAHSFPRAVLVFATFREQLDAHEIKLLRKLAKLGNQSREDGLLANPVVILTGTELFAKYDFASEWSRLSGYRQRVAKAAYGIEDLEGLSRVTCKAYLDQ